MKWLKRSLSIVMTDSLENWSMISLNDTQWAAKIADEYPDQVVEAVYKNSYEGYESWNDIFVFFEDDCLGYI